MTALTPDLEMIGAQLQHAYARRLRMRRAVRLSAVAATVAATVAVTAVAATGDLQLDPTKWAIVGGGSVDNGRGEYVHARSLQDGRPSTFMVEHDAGMDRYDAFLLHERLKDAADATSSVEVPQEPAALCTRGQLARVEQETLDALRANAAPSSPADCRGVAYGVELARHVFTGVEPAENLMPGVD